jgi:hypothetical protein
MRKDNEIVSHPGADRCSELAYRLLVVAEKELPAFVRAVEEIFGVERRGFVSQHDASKRSKLPAITSPSCAQTSSRENLDARRCQPGTVLAKPGCARTQRIHLIEDTVQREAGSPIYWKR